MSGHKGQLMVSGHVLVRVPGTATPVRYTGEGVALVVPNGLGAGLCTCGLLSPVLVSINARRAWHRRHREEIAEVPWSNAAMAKAETKARARGRVLDASRMVR